MGPRERLVCGLGAVFLGQPLQKQVSRVNPCALAFFGGVQGEALGESGNQFSPGLFCRNWC